MLLLLMLYETLTGTTDARSLTSTAFAIQYVVKINNKTSTVARL